ncbi:MAG: hypothetical protein WCD81_04965 [Candidatus Bathyarchaeia archaeon]
MDESLTIAPIQIKQRSGYKPIVFSMFQDFCFLIWSDPVIKRNKPVVHLASGLHSVLSATEANIYFGELEDLSTEERLQMDTYLTFLKREIISDDKSRSLMDCEDRIVSEKSTDKYAFDISGCKCYVLVGQQTSFNETKRELHLLNMTRANDLLILERLDRIIDVIEDVSEKQKVLAGSAGRAEEGIREIKEMGSAILAEISKTPGQIKTILNRQDEIRQIVAAVATRLEEQGSTKAKEAKRYLNKTISTAADLIQIVSFLTGIVSLPSLASTGLIKEVNEFLRNLKLSLTPTLNP